MDIFAPVVELVMGTPPEFTDIYVFLIYVIGVFIRLGLLRVVFTLINNVLTGSNLHNMLR
jgi:hypothetical protein